MSKLHVGIVGTGYVARTRGEIFRQDHRTQLVAIAGSQSRVSLLAQEWGITGYYHWSDLVKSKEVDLVVVCCVNSEHSAVVRQALQAGKAVIVDYPIALSYREALELVELAEQKRQTLHLEQIELLGGVHRQVREWLPLVGKPQYVRYATQTPQRPAPIDRWTYQPAKFGFPLFAAVSRLHRLIDLFGMVSQVSCQLRYEGSSMPYAFSTCICHALLQFADGHLGEVGYHKGAHIWQSERVLDVHGEAGGIFFRGDVGKLVTANQEQEVQTESAKGLFRRDTEIFLQHLYEGAPLYVDRAKILHALATASACEQAATYHQVVKVTT